ncbi:MAG: hypothetical protein WEB29_03085 [Chloroflexota bacterium]
MIEGKVARILNSRELVINRGLAHGVQVGMRFEVLDPNSEDIRDPDTQEVIGSVYRPKVNVEAVIVEDRLSVARTYERTGGTGGLAALSLSRAFYGEPSRPVTLKTDEEMWEPLTEADSYVKRGDPVREIVVENEN